jgi:quercetin dioxygenase-like cupin family protein
MYGTRPVAACRRRRTAHVALCHSWLVNIWDDEWGEQPEDWSGGGGRSKPLVERGPFLGASLYELDRGNFVVYHAHHGSEELLIVLRGQPTLRTSTGERQLDEGEVVYFPAGPAGAHGIRNDTNETVRYLVAGTRVSPEIVEYPDLGQVTGQSRHGIFFIHDVDERRD